MELRCLHYYHIHALFCALLPLLSWPGYRTRLDPCSRIHHATKEKGSDVCSGTSCCSSWSRGVEMGLFHTYSYVPLKFLNLARHFSVWIHISKLSWVSHTILTFLSDAVILGRRVSVSLDNIWICVLKRFLQMTSDRMCHFLPHFFFLFDSLIVMTLQLTIPLAAIIFIGITDLPTFGGIIFQATNLSAVILPVLS